MVYAGTQSRSFRQAEMDLKRLAELDISEQRIMRATKRIGQERVAEREAETAAWEELSLLEQQGSPRGQVPQLACVEMDGGRIQIRDRSEEELPAEEVGKGRFWRETKVGCLLSMTSETSLADPCPEIPEIFIDSRRMGQISREIKGFSAVGEAATREESTEAPASKKRRGQPEVLVRSVVAAREKVEAFGKQLAAAAWRRGFMAAARKAFVGDGSETNWSVWRRYFSHFTPIVDFVHIESTIKQINRRVKGSEKFWSSGGSEALLQLAADHLSETDPLTTFWRCRSAQATGQRSYQTAG